MLQEIGIRSNLSLIVLTVVVVCLTVLYIIESRRINRELNGIKEKLHVAYEEILKLKGKDIEDKANKEEVVSVEGDVQDTTETKKPQEPQQTREPKEQTSLEKQSPQPKLSPLPTPLGNPLLAMMMGGPPPGMGTVSISQNIEEWDDELDKPQELLEEETETDKKIEDDDEEQYDEDSEEEGEEEGEEEDDEEENIPEISEIQISTDHVDSSYSVKQLQDICKKNELSYSGNKTQLIDRINEFFKN